MARVRVIPVLPKHCVYCKKNPRVNAKQPIYKTSTRDAYCQHTTYAHYYEKMGIPKNWPVYRFSRKSKQFTKLSKKETKNLTALQLRELNLIWTAEINLEAAKKKGLPVIPYDRIVGVSSHGPTSCAKTLNHDIDTMKREVKNPEKQAGGAFEGCTFTPYLDMGYDINKKSLYAFPALILGQTGAKTGRTFVRRNTAACYSVGGMRGEESVKNCPSLEKVFKDAIEKKEMKPPTFKPFSLFSSSTASSSWTLHLVPPGSSTPATTWTLPSSPSETWDCSLALSPEPKITGFATPTPTPTPTEDFDDSFVLEMEKLIIQ